MTRAVVSGAAGFIGVHLVNELIQNGVEVIALCRDRANAGRLPGGATIVECPMDGYGALGELIGGKRPDVFFHLAWEGATGPGRADAELQIKNAQWACGAMQAAKDIGCGKFIATGTVYENFYGQTVDATAFKNAAFYYMAKRFARDMLRQLALKVGIAFVWCTFCHPVGRYMKPEQMVAFTVKSLTGGVSPAFGPAEDFFDVIAAEDLAAGLYLAGATELSQTGYYIGSGAARPLRDYLAEMPGILGVDTKVQIGAKPDDGMRFLPEWFDGTRFAAETGFAPRVSFEDAIRNVRDYLGSGF